MRESFEPAEDFSRIVSEEELRALLLRWESEPELEVPDVPDGHVTVDALCELTGMSEHEVRNALVEVRKQDREMELARRLRELEEPMYRVERPGHTPHDPLVQRPLARKELFSKLLDSQPVYGETKLAPRKVQHTSHEKFAGAIANLVLLVFTVATIVLVGWAVVSALR